MLYTPTPFVMATSPQYSSASSSFFCIFPEAKTLDMRLKKILFKSPFHPFTVDSDTLDSSAKAFFRRGEANAQIHCNALCHPPRMSILYSQKNIIFNKKNTFEKEFLFPRFSLSNSIFPL